VLQPSFLVGAHLTSGALVEVLPRYRSIELGGYGARGARRFMEPTSSRRIQ